MARDPQTIQAEIERAREGLTVAVDELTTRLDPRRAINEGKSKVHAIWANPRTKAVVYGAGALVTYLLVRKIFR